MGPLACDGMGSTEVFLVMGAVETVWVDIVVDVGEVDRGMEGVGIEGKSKPRCRVTDLLFEGEVLFPDLYCLETTSHEGFRTIDT